MSLELAVKAAPSVLVPRPDSRELALTRAKAAIKPFVLGDCEGLGHYEGRHGYADVTQFDKPYFSQKQP
jgi:hypothetical protein